MYNQHLKRYLLHLLVSNKNNLTNEEFNETFYKNVKYSNIKYIKGQFDDFLNALYNIDDKIYNDWFNKIKSLQYSFIKTNNELVTKLINERLLNEIFIANDMCIYQMQLIHRKVPSTNMTSILKNSKTLLIDIKSKLQSIQSENDDNIIIMMQNEFDKKYGTYKDNIYLNDLYNEIMNSFELYTKNELQTQLNKIEKLTSSRINTISNSHEIETSHNNIKRYVRK